MTAPQNVEHAVYLNTPPPLPTHTHFQPLHKSTNKFFLTKIYMYMHMYSKVSIYMIEVDVQVQKALQFLCMKGNNSHLKIYKH